MLGFSPIGFLPLGFSILALSSVITVGGSMVVSSPGSGMIASFSEAAATVNVAGSTIFNAPQGGISINLVANGMVVSNA
ncbi:hypothetical protein [Novosphingobium sp.]|uniref:hypothetical protein n=1 Tax=Novosphingobium sp. TaxID=1874826 RepID=UPI00286E9519|nr:hypothetical protein [Novosphingobium sp.]